MDRFLQNYFPHIGITFMSASVLYAYLHYELLSNNHDLLYWQEMLRLAISELVRYKYAYTFITFIALLNLILICAAIPHKSSSSWLEEEEREQELRKQYRDLLLIRLLNAVDKAETRYLRTESATSTGRIAFENYICAHNEIWSAILDFRKDAHKLFKLNETEIWLPLEDVFNLTDEEENEVKRTKYYKAKVTIDAETLAALLYDD